MYVSDWSSDFDANIVLASREPRLSNTTSLLLPVRILSLCAASILFIASVANKNVLLVARKSNRTLLIASHAARVEQAAPQEDPGVR
jgi:hypothetical protein